MDKLLDKEVHQLFKASPNDAEMSNYLVSSVSSCTKHSAAESAVAVVNSADCLMLDKTGDEGFGGDCQDEPKHEAESDTAACLQGKTKSKSSTQLG